MSVKGTSIGLNKGFRKYWLIQKLGARELLARFNFTSSSPQFMCVTLQVSLQVKSQPVSVHRLSHFIRTNVREKKNAPVLPRTEWVKSAVVVGRGAKRNYLCVL